MVAAAFLHILSIPISLIISKALAESIAGVSVSWAEYLAALEEVGFLVIILAGVLLQVLFAIVALVGAFLLHRGNASGALPMVGAGIAAVAVSLAVLGGVVGLVGGVLSIAGGVIARPRASLGPPPFSPPAVPPPAKR